MVFDTHRKLCAPAFFYEPRQRLRDTDLFIFPYDLRTLDQALYRKDLPQLLLGLLCRQIQPEAFLCPPKIPVPVLRGILIRDRMDGVGLLLVVLKAQIDDIRIFPQARVKAGNIFELGQNRLLQHDLPSPAVQREPGFHGYGLLIHIHDIKARRHACPEQEAVE